MKRVGELPFAVREIENLWIPIGDGLRLAARAWLPRTADKVPAILEYIPYRKRDMTALRDAATHRYLAGHGYACFRVDVRGTGESEGRYGNQFAAQYAEDAIAVIDWLARQEWCDGQVAMFGLSWGGAIALQTAARRPARLKAIVCAAGVDDRYALRYPGGCLTTATINAITAQIVYATKPPDPALVGEAWRAIWRDRLDAVAPVGEAWLEHRERDAFWRAESLAEDYRRIACPMLLAAGWADPAFASAMLRVLAHATAPRRALLGAWGHRFPHVGRPGPAIGWLQETLRWLDHWLKGRTNGAMEAPLLRAWMPEDSLIDARPVTRAGRWISCASWPPAADAQHAWCLARGRLSPTRADDEEIAITFDPGVGEASGEGMPIFTTGPNPELAADQRDDDARSTCFDSAPLAARLELLGEAVLTLRLTRRPAQGLIAARLCELRPDGASRRVACGFARVMSDDVELRFDAVGDGFNAGSRIRLALSRDYWPLLWPAGDAGELTIAASSSRLVLPEVPNATKTIAAPPEPEAAALPEYVELLPARYARDVVRDAVSGEEVVTIVDDIGEGRLAAIDLTMTDATTREFRRDPAKPDRVSVRTIMRWSLARGDWRVAGEVVGEARRQADGIALTHECAARENGVELFRRRWQSTLFDA